MHDFERVVTLVTVGHHAKVVGHPERTQIKSTVATDPTPVPCQVVVAEHVHVFNLPLEALAVLVVPCAVTTALLGPEIDHLASVISRVSNHGGNSE